MKKKVVILEGSSYNHNDLSWAKLEEICNLTIYQKTKPEEVLERSKGFEIIITNKIVFTEKIMEQLPELKYIGVGATGYNVVDLDAARSHGIIVSNIPAYSTNSVAQLTFAHILNIYSQVGLHNELVKQGEWQSRGEFSFVQGSIFELTHKKIGIVGYGSIGKAVADIAHSFGMNVFVYSSKEVTELPKWVTKMTLDDLFSSCDIISLHCPMTPDTAKMVSYSRLVKMKSSAILINTSRGGLIDEPALAQALNNQLLYAYATDVMTDEPPANENPLLKARNCYITPHLAWATKEARSRLINILIKNIQTYINESPINVVS
ncbi:MAG: D-2-hydroxyacid dehydrogenase [Bacteroidaceae bacterium]